MANFFEDWKMLLFGIVGFSLFIFGWECRDWYQDKKDILELSAAQKAITAAQNREDAISAKVETKLADLKANERVIEHEKIKLVDRPVYKSDCLDIDGLRVVNASKAGNTTKPAR